MLDKGDCIFCPIGGAARTICGSTHNDTFRLAQITKRFIKDYKERTGVDVGFRLSFAASGTQVGAPPRLRHQSFFSQDLRCPSAC